MSRIAGRLLMGLDSWLEADPANQSVLDVLAKADPNVDRSLLRGAIARKDLVRLQEQVRGLGGNPLPIPTAYLFGMSRLVDVNDAVGVLKNTLNDQHIANQTIINASSNAMSTIKGMNSMATITDGLARGIGR